MKKSPLLILLAFFTFMQTKAQGPGAETFSSDVARDWFGTELYLIKNGTGFTPPVASRAIGYTGLALYEALQDGIQDYISIESQLPGSPVFSDPVSGTDYHWPTVANNCLATIIDSLFGNASVPQKDSIHNLRDNWNAVFQGSVSPAVYLDSKNFGEQLARDVFTYSTTDGAHQGYLSNTDPSYVPPVGPGLWVPTPPAYGMALQPHWGDNRPFVVADTMSPIIPAAPPVYSADSTSAMFGYAWQVYNTVNNLSPAQVNIANYWGDGGGTVTPPGHSISILTQILDTENSDLAFAARAYAMLGMSQTDAFISCWRTKYRYNVLRPVSYIRDHIDSTWSPLLGTPPFPEYTSGHSTQSGAMTSVMNYLFGATYSFTDNTHGVSFGGPRFFSCFDEAAYEAATSRLYGGIHYEFSDVLAITLGKNIGDNIVDLFLSANVGVDDGRNENAFIRFYPNPTADYALISYDGFDFGQAEVYDANGVLIFASANNAVLDLAQLPAGNYLVRVVNKTGTTLATEKVVKL